jgi:glycosyltransferase involved in cell wall biosynthesis
MAAHRLLVVNHAVEMGGAERVLIRLLDSLDRDLFEPELACPSDGPLTEEARARRIPVHLGHPSSRLLAIRRRSLGGNRIAIAAYPFDLVGSVARLARLVRSGRFDLVFANSAKADIYGTLAARAAGRPSVIRLHDIIDTEAFNRLNVWLMKTCSRHLASRVITVSRASEDAMASLGVPRSKLLTVYNGIDLEAEGTAVDRDQVRRELGLEAGVPLAGLVGRLVDWKGPDYFIRAAALVAEGNPGARFALVGDAVFGEKDYVDSLKELAGSLGISNSVVFTGFRQDVSRIIASLDVLVQASTLPDPLPTVLVEAMARSRPVVASYAGGVPEMVEDGVTGLTVPPRDTDAMATAMAALLSDPAKASRMGQAGHERARELFDIKKTTRVMEDALLEVMGAGRPAPGHASGVPRR